MMGITFGIITDGQSPGYLRKLIESIIDLKIALYEIVIVGSKTVPILDDHLLKEHPRVRWIPFDEDQRPGWITRKKNIIVNTAMMQYVCLVHDYFLFDKDWYEGVVKFTKTQNGTWNILTNPIKTLEGGRHSDWVVNPNYMERFLLKDREALSVIKANYPDDNPKYVVGLPYVSSNVFNKIQYISGGYIFAESFVLKEYPLNETLTWGQEEDLEWSQVINQFFPIDFNPFSTVNLQKPNKWNVKSIPEEILPKLAKFYGLQYGK